MFGWQRSIDRRRGGVGALVIKGIAACADERGRNEKKRNQRNKEFFHRVMISFRERIIRFLFYHIDKMMSRKKKFIFFTYL